MAYIRQRVPIAQNGLTYSNPYNGSVNTNYSIPGGLNMFSTLPTEIPQNNYGGRLAEFANSNLDSIMNPTGSPIVNPSATAFSYQPAGITPTPGTQTGIDSATWNANTELLKTPLAAPPLAPAGPSASITSINADLRDQTNAIKQQQKQNFVNPDQEQEYSNFPFGADYDLTARLTQLGRGIGSMQGEDGDRSFGNIAGNVVAPAVSFLAGAARTIMSPIAQMNMNRQIKRNNQQRMEDAYYDDITREGELGGTYYGPGQKFTVRDMTGEHIYPLPKSVQDNANLIIEGGEYYLSPDGSGPMEATGPKHKDGGVPISAEDGAIIVTDKTKITDDFAKLLRSDYGVNVTSKSTYADAIDKYKKKIGLSKLYEEKEALLSRLNKVGRFEDKAAREMSNEWLNGELADLEDRIKPLDQNLAQFSNIVAASQEQHRDKSTRDHYFGDGGVFSGSDFDKMLKENNLTREEGENIIMSYISGNKGLPLAQEGIVFSPVSNRFNTKNNEYGRQSGNKGAFGEAGNNLHERLYELTLQFPVLAMGDKPLLTADMNTKTAKYANPNSEVGAQIQQGIQNTYSALRAFAPYVKNRKEFEAYLSRIEFGGEPGPNTKDPSAAYNARAMEGKLGEYSTSRETVELKVVDPEQLEKLNKVGIYNYVQLARDADKGKEILGENAYSQLMKFSQYEGTAGIDFRLGAYDTPNGSTAVAVEAPKTVEQQAATGSLSTPAQQQAAQAEEQGQVQYQQTIPQRQRSNRSQLMFPSVFRITPSAIMTRQMQRFDYLNRTPALRSMDAYIGEVSRNMSASLDLLGEMPDSQRGAILSNMTAVAAQEAAKVFSETSAYNEAERRNTSAVNEQMYMNTNMNNIAARQDYEASTLKALAMDEANWDAYVNSLNEEYQQKFNMQTYYNTVQSMFPNASFSPDGTVAYDQNGMPLIYPGKINPALVGLTQQELNTYYKSTRTSPITNNNQTT